MAASSYDEALARLLAHEGGYSNHPADPGGPTNFGITIADYRRYVKPNATPADVRAMTIDEAKAIYRARYWDAMRCDELPIGIDYCIFDYAVHSGTGRATKVLQRCLGVAVTGRMDDATIAAARRADVPRLIDAICDERLRFLQSLKTWPVFGRGWARRVAEVRAASHAMVTANVTVAARAPATSAATPGRGAVPINRHAQRTSAAAVIVAGGVAATQTREPAALFIIIVAAVAVAAGTWFFWRWWQRYRQGAQA
jgi:lysozyme family protein